VYLYVMAKQRRRLFNFYLAESGHEWLNDLSGETGTDKSTIVRLSLALARQHEKELRQLIRSNQ
jgi:hypothetical protein